MADTTGFGEPSIRSSTACSPGSTGGLPNSVMSAPAMNVRPAHTITTAWTAPSAAARPSPSCNPLRTCWLRALTGGLSTVSTATRPRVSRSTDWVIFAMNSSVPILSPRLGRRVPSPATACGAHYFYSRASAGGSRDGLRRALLYLAAEPRGEVDEVARHHVPLPRQLHVAGLARAVLRRPRDERGAEAHRAGRGAVAVVGGDHHALLGLEAQHRGRRQVALGLGLVMARDLRPEDRVPREPAVLGHVHHQRDVAVRERRQDVLLLEAGEAGHAVRPGIEAMPRAVEMVDFSVRQPLDRELPEQLLEALAMEIVELRPRAPAAPYLVHRRLIEAAPRVGELRPVDREALRLPEGLALADDARSPVHDRPEHVERERFDVHDGHVLSLGSGPQCYTPRHFESWNALARPGPVRPDRAVARGRRRRRRVGAAARRRSGHPHAPRGDDARRGRSGRLPSGRLRDPAQPHRREPRRRQARRRRVPGARDSPEPRALEPVVPLSGDRAPRVRPRRGVVAALESLRQPRARGGAGAGPQGDRRAPADGREPLRGRGTPRP